jgi:hypothetical protein
MTPLTTTRTSGSSESPATTTTAGSGTQMDLTATTRLAQTANASSR